MRRVPLSSRFPDPKNQQYDTLDTLGITSVSQFAIRIERISIVTQGVVYSGRRETPSSSAERAR